jgi:hypothetical protein
VPSAKRAASWQTELIDELVELGADGPFASVLRAASMQRCGVHLAVLVEPYLTYILDGRKTVESRFSVNRNAPYEQVCRGDLIVLKRSSGPVVGFCRVSHVWFYRLLPDTWPEIERFASALCMDDSEFWQSKKAASYATLMRIEDVTRVVEFDVKKLDPRGWVVIQPCVGSQESLF